MCYDNFLITKRDGTTERFSLEKIKSAILKAFESVSEHVHAEDMQRVMDNLRFCNGMSVEESFQSRHGFKIRCQRKCGEQEHSHSYRRASKIQFHPFESSFAL